MTVMFWPRQTNAYRAGTCTTLRGLTTFGLMYVIAKLKPKLMSLVFLICLVTLYNQKSIRIFLPMLNVIQDNVDVSRIVKVSS